MKRIILSLLVVLSGMAAMAQTTTYEGFGIYGLDVPKVKKTHFGLELSLAGEVGLGLRIQRNFGKYIAWDILQAKYTYDYTPTEVDEEEDGYLYRDDDCSAHKLAIMTGLRGFSPSFANDKMKMYLSFAAGYGRTMRPELKAYHLGYGYTGQAYEDEEWFGHCAIDFSFGFQYKKFNFGYGLYAMTGDFGMVDHTIRLGFTF